MYSAVLPPPLMVFYYQERHSSNIWYSLLHFSPYFLSHLPSFCCLNYFHAKSSIIPFISFATHRSNIENLNWKNGSLALKLSSSYVLLKQNSKDTYQMSKLSQHYNHSNISYNLPVPLQWYQTHFDNTLSFIKIREFNTKTMLKLWSQ